MPFEYVFFLSVLRLLPLHRHAIFGGSVERVACESWGLSLGAKDPDGPELYCGKLTWNINGT